MRENLQDILLMVLQNSAYIDHVFLIDISHCLSLLDISDLPVNYVNVPSQLSTREAFV